MSANACARCGAEVEPGEHLCWRCRQELPIERPAATAQVTGPASAGVRTFRGQPIPDGMVLPSRRQYHGTVFGAIAIGLAVVLALGVLVSKGVGPFTVSNIQTSLAGASSASASGGLVTTAVVQNMGDHPGQARCVAFWSDPGGATHPTAVVETSVIEPNATATVSIPLPFGASTETVSVSCK